MGEKPPFPEDFCKIYAAIILTREAGGRLWVGAVRGGGRGRGRGTDRRGAAFMLTGTGEAGGPDPLGPEGRKEGGLWQAGP